MLGELLHTQPHRIYEGRKHLAIDGEDGKNNLDSKVSRNKAMPPDGGIIVLLLYF